MQPEGLSKKSHWPLLGIDPATFRFVAQCVNQLLYLVRTSWNKGHVFLISAVDETLRCLSFTLRNGSLIIVNSEAGGPQSRFWHVDEEKIPCSCLTRPSISSVIVKLRRLTLTVCCSTPISFFIFEHKLYRRVSLHSWETKAVSVRGWCYVQQPKLLRVSVKVWPHSTRCVRGRWLRKLVTFVWCF
jgi:hypothetical protein